MICPKCNSQNVFLQPVQNKSGTIINTNRYKKSHGCLYWILIGWWNWILELIAEIIVTVCISCISTLFKKKRTICTCQDCGNIWRI